tara:strand:+ start:173 stop:1075 length:903 start_codon:yes stop_codon:yes gene_type:complete
MLYYKTDTNNITNVNENISENLIFKKLLLGSNIRPNVNINNTELTKLIHSKLMSEMNKWSDIIKKNSFLYNTKSTISASKYAELQNTNSQLQNQLDKFNDLNNNNDTLTKNIYSTQRQVQIADDNSRRRNQNIFLLKLLFTYELLIIIPLLMQQFFSNRFNSTHVLLLMVFISLPFVYILYKNLRSIQSRSAIRWPLRNWAKGPLLNPDNPRPTPTCPPPIKTCSPEAKHNINILTQEIKDVKRLERQLDKDTKKLNRLEHKLERGLCQKYKKCPQKDKNNLKIKCDRDNITNDISKWKW